MRWMYYTKDIGKQVNIALLAGVIFILFFTIFDYFEKPLDFLKWVSLFCAIYFLVFALMFSKKWIDKMYK